MTMRTKSPSKSSNSRVKLNPITDDSAIHVIARMRREASNPNGSHTEMISSDPSMKILRIQTEEFCREFHLDGVSFSSDENLCIFYQKYVKDGVLSVKGGGKSTILMYGATGSGKSYTMFGSEAVEDPGIAFLALNLITQDLEVRIKVVEIYNEEIYDLLAPSMPNRHGEVSRAAHLNRGRMTKVANACSIHGSDAQRVVEEIEKVEKKRSTRSTNCNARSSRSHCMIIIDVPQVGGRLTLVDMAGSENIEQAGHAQGAQNKMQTGKINQGNAALKRVVESIANGGSHVPYRDSKLTMLLQDSFQDEKSRLLMILCASAEPKNIQKTIATFEYGSKAKSIVRLPGSPITQKPGGPGDQRSVTGLKAKISYMETFISKLQEEILSKDEKRMTAEEELAYERDKAERLTSLLVRERNKAVEANVKMGQFFNKVLHLANTIDRREKNFIHEVKQHVENIDDYIEKLEQIASKLMRLPELQQIQHSEPEITKDGWQEKGEIREENGYYRSEVAADAHPSPLRTKKLTPLNSWDEEIQFFNIGDLKQNEVICGSSEEEFEDTLPPQGEISQVDGLRTLSIKDTKVENQVEQIKKDDNKVHEDSGRQLPMQDSVSSFTAQGFLDRGHWGGGLSFTGWLPRIPEGINEGEDDDSLESGELERERDRPIDFFELQKDDNFKELRKKTCNSSVTETEMLDPEAEGISLERDVLSFTQAQRKKNTELQNSHEVRRESKHEKDARDKGRQSHSEEEVEFLAMLVGLPPLSGKESKRMGNGTLEYQLNKSQLDCRY
ncbi:hypothetical protein AMTRI_Chr13g89020 [Amborella trichopoda]